QSSVPAGSMSSTTNSAVAGDTSATSSTGTASDSSVPNSGQSMDQSTTNTQPRPSEDKGAAGKNANPTDATDQPAQ
ncbi:MAG: hypothetical protein JF571_12230, partial [Asticcacaulis sp.]|nr:hypothetical protein [Asticcacaulis sp.]